MISPSVHEMEPPISKCNNFYRLRQILVERNMKAEQLRAEMLEQAAKNRRDLTELHGSLETLKAVKRLPRMTLLHQMASQERINQSGWDAYVRKHIVPYERVSLPPDEDVDIDLLTNKLLSKGVNMLPPPRQTCSQNFFPSCDSSFVFGMTRPRELVCGARLPNTIIVALLWSTRTLGDVEAERRSRRRRLCRQLRGEQELYDSDFSSSDSLQSRLPDPYRRGGIGDASEAEFAMAEAVWTLQWEMAQPLRHRQRAVPTRRKSRREALRGKHRGTKIRARSASRRSASRPRRMTRSASTEEPSSSRQDVDRARASSVASSKSSRRRTRTAPEVRQQQPKAYVRTVPEAATSDDGKDRAWTSLDKRPVFKNVVSMPSEHILPSMFVGEYDEDQRRMTLFMRETRAKPWLLDIIPSDQRNPSMTPWQLNNIIMNNLPRSDPKLRRQAIRQIAKIIDEFSRGESEDMRQKMLEFMLENLTNAEVFDEVLQAQERSLNTPPDELIPHLLGVYPLCPDATRAVIDTYLLRVGLDDPSGVLRYELASWSKTEGRTTSKAALRRKAHHFLAQWRESWECNARLVAEELRQERLEAKVRADMVRALARHEPSVVHYDDENITIQLADQPSKDFVKSPSTIDVLNYFVELSEPVMPETPPVQQKARKPPANEQYRRWRRDNEDLVCAERAGLALRDHPSPSTCLQQPTTLVTHVREGLAPLPWPVGTLSVTLRVAGKFFYHELGHSDHSG